MECFVNGVWYPHVADVLFGYEPDRRSYPLGYNGYGVVDYPFYGFY